MSYLLKPVSDWTTAELEQALEDHRSGRAKLQYGVEQAARSRLEASRANKQLAIERTETARQKRLLLSLTVTDQKPAGSLDIRSVKHAAIDATTKKGGPQVRALAMLVAGYEWLVKQEILPKGIPDKWRGTALVVAVLLAAGWWLILFAVRLVEKWNAEYTGRGR